MSQTQLSRKSSRKKKSRKAPSREKRTAQTSLAKGTKPVRAPRAIRRGAILERAALLMKEKGFAGMSARELAHSLDFSKANFFYHVRNKEEILYEIFVSTLEYTLRNVEEVLARPDSNLEKLRGLVDVYVRLMIDHSAEMWVWFKERGHLTRKHATHVTDMESRLLARLNDFYAAGMRDGDFRAGDPRITRMAVFGACFMLIRLPGLAQYPPPAAISSQFQEIICEGLIRRK
jgi:AcrR family transcriptional regulator